MGHFQEMTELHVNKEKVPGNMSFVICDWNMQSTGGFWAGRNIPEGRKGRIEKTFKA